MSNHIALLTAYNEWWLCRVSENHKYSILTPYYSAVNEQSYRAAHCLQQVVVLPRVKEAW